MIQFTTALFLDVSNICFGQPQLICNSPLPFIHEVSYFPQMPGVHDHELGSCHRVCSTSSCLSGDYIAHQKGRTKGYYKYGMQLQPPYHILVCFEIAYISKKSRQLETPCIATTNSLVSNFIHSNHCQVVCQIRSKVETTLPKCVQRLHLF